MTHEQHATHYSIIRYLSSLGALSQQRIHFIDDHQSSICPLCGDPDGSMSHLLWRCTHHKLLEARQSCGDAAVGENVHQNVHQASHRLQHLILDNIEHIPTSILHGLTPHLQAVASKTFWSDGCNIDFDAHIPMSE
eukprot:5943380-Karenia_brevis.AAC.1